MLSIIIPEENSVINENMPSEKILSISIIENLKGRILKLFFLFLIKNAFKKELLNPLNINWD